MVTHQTIEKNKIKLVDDCNYQKIMLNCVNSKKRGGKREIRKALQREKN